MDDYSAEKQYKNYAYKHFAELIKEGKLYLTDWNSQELLLKAIQEEAEKDIMQYSTQKYTYWENTKNGHNKFWAATIKQEKRIVNTTSGTKEITVYILVRKWGAIGTEGQTMQQEFNSAYDSEVMLNKLIYDKETKGYKGVF